MSRLKIFLVVIVIAALAWGLWGAFRSGPEPLIELSADRAAIGAGTLFTARFAEPELGLVSVSLEVQQGERVKVLADANFETPSPFDPFADALTPEHLLEANVGIESQDWLEEGEATVRARAVRFTGPFGSGEVTEEITQEVILRPPSLGLVSNRHYLRQGGAGAVQFVVGERAVRSGVVAGDAEFKSFPMPGGNENARFTIFGIPFDMDDASRLRLFAEDAAGNRAEIEFADIFKKKPPTRDTINLPDSFLRRVVGPILSQSPGFRAEGSLLDQYLAINGTMRVQNRAFVKELCDRSREERLWSGSFLQLPNSQKMARYADTRTYRYDGESVDTQTHLGLDLASIAQAPVPAANAGEVVFAGYLGIYGNAVAIDHGYGLVSLYAHLSSIGTSEGAIVRRGDIVGRSGATGLAGGDHLHFGVFVQGVAVDPIEWLDGKWIRERIDPKIPAPPRAEG